MSASVYPGALARRVVEEVDDGCRHGDTGRVQDDDDDYGREPSWPVALVVGGLTSVVGVVARVRNRLRRRPGRDEPPSPGRAR